jgi:LPS sulfotransferase NodH
MTPIFMIGTQRSGSNLLRLMLNQLSQIASPHPPHILQRMMPLMDKYGDLQNDETFSQLVDDVCRLVELNPVQWENIEFDRAEVEENCVDRSVVAIQNAIYGVYTASQNAACWCCKSLENISYIEAIEETLPEVKYIYLYRDGRDVAVSFKKAVVGEKFIYNIADGWAKSQRVALSWKEKLSPERFFAISYERLTAETEVVAKELCAFLQVEYTENMLDFHKTSEAKNAAQSSKLWENVTKPVMSDNTKKYLRELSIEEMILFEAVAGDVLDQLNYPREYLSAESQLVYTEQALERFNQRNDEMKEKAMEGVDKEDLERRQRQQGLLKEIQARP